MVNELAGRLRARLTVERWVGVPDGAGGFTGEGWRASGRVWAELAAAGHRNGVEAEARRARTRMKATLRPCSVDAACRLRWDGRLFQVLAVTRDPATPDRTGLLIEEAA